MIVLLGLDMIACAETRMSYHQDYILMRVEAIYARTVSRNVASDSVLQEV